MKKLLFLPALLLAAPAQSADNFVINDALGQFQTICAVDNGGVKTICSSGGSGGTASQVQGPAASGTSAVGNPVIGGAVYNANPVNRTEGQASQLQAGTEGALWMQLMAADSTTTPSIAQAATAGFAVSTVGLTTRTGNYAHGNTQWNPAFQCESSAVIDLAGGSAVTEIVPLTAAQTIRVCSFVVSASVASSIQFSFGTGANCGTGNTVLTGTMALAAGQSIELSGMNGSLFRGAVANALCVDAGAADVDGFITYAKF